MTQDGDANAGNVRALHFRGHQIVDPISLRGTN